MQWLANVCSGLAGLFAAQPRAPAPGTNEHLELRVQVRREFLAERAKPPEQRDVERALQLRIQELRLGIEDCEQAREELSAALERRPARVVALSRLELPERVVQEMRRVPAMDLCAACHRKLEAAEAREELLIKWGQDLADDYRRVGLLREQQAGTTAAPVVPQQQQEPPVVGAVAPAPKQQQQQQEQQQGAPASDTPTGVLDMQQRLQLRGSSSEEHEVEEAAGGEQAAAGGEQVAALQAAQAPLLHSRRRRQDAAGAF
ncbi:hypothetical protein CHLNCDRAFT_141024 [Chlorella variabilis]|uniref:Uncharacterized protein n=1 Tax=Chlorella variabilis TaxID=554065 RepID=E1ZS00_CHLVA|nr:hypothetical protein CHLNCDRAFT_141024 [Chlorella variabilis]EFN51396.1 hypothetical protein CHLNCDRAFT_141024 [Chlorella variabilis]|eukprot:XP_005843498.1 hypothetical protein CHLNCDRAFT_141024 [Chlorella variabilis]